MYIELVKNGEICIISFEDNKVYVRKVRIKIKRKVSSANAESEPPHSSPSPYL